MKNYGAGEAREDAELFTLSGGEGDDVLLLLHGLGATADVWRPLVSRLPGQWRGQWLAPDLPGHGRSSKAASYAAGSQAASIARVLPAGGRVYVLAHSLGGIIGVLLASQWFGAAVYAVAAFSVKVVWTDEEKDMAARRASATPKYFASRGEALSFYLKVAGLAGLVPEDDPVAATGVVEDVHGWRLAADPATAGVGGPPLAPMLAAATCPIVLAAGRRDPMVKLDTLRNMHSPVVDLGDLGHNPHVEAPDTILQLVRDLPMRSG
ncbi:alpha/beta hydrolase [Paraburkholderia sediminicola]|uniref:Alpha/beta hydrolase n=1 Tax=Paraburkholderia metrosideri TaxID=580937 RepID=A0ABW9DLC4_9BURK